MASIDRVITEEKIPYQMYDNCLKQMKESYAKSVYNVFHNKDRFFKQMAPRLKQKIFAECMSHELK